MIEELKISNIDQPKSVIFPIKRKVLTEKFHKRDFNHYQNTILIPGEHVWLIDANSLVIERYTISHAPKLSTEGNKVYFYDKKGQHAGMQITVDYYLRFLNENKTINISYVCGKKYICSSERNVLITLKKCIPEVAKLIQANLNRKNTAAVKVKGKKTQLKKLQKLHKKIVEYLSKN